MLEELANSMIDETVSELKQKAKKAMHGAEIKTQKKLMQMIEKDMLENYYAGYSPMYYRRTFQLDKSVTPKTRLNESQREISLDLGIDFYPDAMSHNPKPQFLNFSPSNIPADEGIIFENFLAGIHPNAIGSSGTTPVQKAAEKAIDDFIDNELIPYIENISL